MRTLFVYPEFPKTFWSYEKILELVNRKVLLPPLGLVTVAALIPQEWEMKLVDRNVREVTDEEWNWAELVIISIMIVQKDDMAVRINKAKQRILPVAVGGPFASSTPDAPELDLADFTILDEGEITLPMFLDALERGETGGRFTAAMMGMLQALPKTALWARLEREGRLIQGEDAAKGVNQTNLLNFEPTRLIRDIANEYVDAFCALYEPNAYMDRVYSY